MKTYLPWVMAAESFAASIAYAYAKDWRGAAYWFFAGVHHGVGDDMISWVAKTLVNLQVRGWPTQHLTTRLARYRAWKHCR